MEMKDNEGVSQTFISVTIVPEGETREMCKSLARLWLEEKITFAIENGQMKKKIQKEKSKGNEYLSVLQCQLRIEDVIIPKEEKKTINLFNENREGGKIKKY